MAEFTEVIRHARRMCVSHDGCANGCPLHEKWGFYHGCDVIDPSYSTTDEQYKEFEQTVMQWAAAHPEPRYPTWMEWYKKTFPDAHKGLRPCPNEFYKICDMREYHGELECYECKNSPIPADIAKKLGVKPIEVDGDN